MLRLEASFCHTPPISALNALVDIESAQANLTGRCCHGPSGQYASMRGPFGVQSGHRSSSPYPIVPCRKVPRSCGFLSGKPRHGSELEIYERVRGWVMVGLIDHTKPPGAPHSREYYPNSITSVLWEMTRIRFSSQTKRHLGHYVYALVDPRDDAIFYVGKASGNNRAYDHLKSETSETSKNRRIKEIREAGAEPLVDILRYGLDTKEACFEVEAAIIDTLGLENLTNSVRGHGIERGRQTAAEVERLYGSKPIDVADISERLMLFFINRTYSPTMPEIEIYDCVRQFWSNVGARRRTPDESGTPHIQQPWESLMVWLCARIRSRSGFQLGLPCRRVALLEGKADGSLSASYYQTIRSSVVVLSTVTLR